MTNHILSGEQFNIRMAATFDAGDTAQQCAKQIKASGLQASQVKLIGPDDKRWGHKVEPEDSGIARTLVRSHLVLGGAGFVVGLIAWGALYALNVGLLRGAPVGSLIAFLFFSTAAGLMLGGFVAMRPDHEVVNVTVQTALEKGKWTLVIHPKDQQQAESVKNTLNENDVDSVRSL